MRTTPKLTRVARVFLFAFAGTGLACGGVKLGSRPSQDGPSPKASAAGAPQTSGANARRDDSVRALNSVDYYRRIGLIAHGAPLPFAGSVSYLAGATADSTNLLIALTLPPSALVFRRESEQQRADYRVVLTLKRGESVVSRVDALEPVRVASVRDAGSQEMSIIFQQLLTVPPGNYSMTVVVSDEASAKKGTVEVNVQAPTFAVGTVTKPVAYFDVTPRNRRDSLPRIVTNPRGVFTYAKDTTVDVYVETYGAPANSKLGFSLQVDSVTVWTDSVELRRSSAGDLATATPRIPVTRLGPGTAYVATWIPGSRDTVKAPILIGYGEGVQATTFSDMISYLRFFAPESRLKTLAAATPQTRGLAWANFYRETDQNPASLPNEALASYMERLRYADAQFSEGSTPGWRTDRGMVFLLFGQYDQAVDPFGASGDRTERGRTLIWEYRSLNLSVEFVRAASFAQWRLTPASEQDVRSMARKQLGGDLQR